MNIVFKHGNMKKLSVISVLIFLLSPGIKAQFFYVKARTGVNYAMDKSSYTTVSHFHTIYFDHTKNDSNTLVSHYSMGEGSTQSVLAGYSLNRFLAVELEMAYTGSKTEKFDWVDNYDQAGNTAYLMHFSYYLERKGHMINLSPALLCYYRFGKFSPYAAAAINLGRCSLEDALNIRLFNTLPGYVGYEHVSEVLKYQDKLVSGYKATAGCGYELFGNLSAYLSFEISEVSSTPVKSRITSYIVNYEDQLKTLSVSQSEYVYVKEPVKTTNKDEPSQLLAGKISYSSWSMNLGVRYNFIRKSGK